MARQPPCVCGGCSSSIAIKTKAALPQRLTASYSCVSLQKSEAKLEEILKEIKSLKDLVSSQEKRIIKLEEQISNIAI